MLHSFSSPRLYVVSKNRRSNSRTPYSPEAGSIAAGRLCLIFDGGASLFANRLYAILNLRHLRDTSVVSKGLIHLFFGVRIELGVLEAILSEESPSNPILGPPISHTGQVRFAGWAVDCSRSLPHLAGSLVLIGSPDFIETCRAELERSDTRLALEGTL